MSETVESKATPEQQAEARKIGWRPPEQFRGDPDKWVDADEFLRRGEEVLPLVKAANRQLTERADNLSREVQRLSAVVAEQRQSMDEMLEFNSIQLREKLAEQKRQLARDLREARKDDNDQLVEELEERLEANAEARAALPDPKRKEEKPQGGGQPQANQPSPEFLAWKENNPWYMAAGRDNTAKTAAANQFAAEAVRAGKTGKAFFDYVDEALAEAFPTPAKRKDPTEEGRPNGGGGGSSSKANGFSSLPAEAKAKAREQVSKFVGEHKMFKTEEAWFSYYAKQYNASEE